MLRILLIAGSVILLMGSAALGYVFFFTPEIDLTVEPGTSTLPIAPGEQFPITQEPSISTDSAPEKISTRLTRITEGPVVPGMYVRTEGASTASSSPDTVVRYIDRKSGNAYTYRASTGTVTRTSNRTVPGIQTATWFADGSAALVRYLSGPSLSTINTYVLRTDGSQGFFLAQDVAEVAIASSTILTLASGVNGSVATTLKGDGSRLAEIFTTPLSKLRISFLGKDRYFAFTKPSGTLDGTAYVISAGRFSTVAGPLPGLVAKSSPSGTWMIVSFVNAGVLQLKLVNLTSGESIALPIGTIADKCVWTADDTAVYCGVPKSPSISATYPDDWYQGAITLNDRLWRIDVAGRYTQLVLDLEKEVESPVDIQTLAIDPNGSMLLFLNKNDGSLWSYAL